MKALFAKRFGWIIKVRVEGSINQKMVQKIHEGLKAALYLPASSLVVAINSKGGSLTQTNNIIDMLNNYCNFKKISYDCFAEDQCLGSANALLVSGKKCYSSNMTMLGGFSFSWTTINAHKWSQLYGVRRQEIVGGKNQIRYNLFEQISPQAQELTKNQLSILQQALKNSIIKFRREKIKQQNMNQLFAEKTFLRPENGVKLGFLDDLVNFQDYYDDKLAGQKIYIVNKRHRYDRIRYAAHTIGFDSGKYRNF